MRIVIKTLFVLSLFQSTIQASHAAECVAKSGAHTVPLLELYTSEGCSSCPPADKWLGDLKQDPSTFTPLAFHVDYWDYIGWKDRFSKAEYSDRQRKIAAFSGIGFVYTPQFVMNGRDFRGWDNARLSEAIDKNKKIASRVNLTLNALTQSNGGTTFQASASAVNPADIKNSNVFVAIYESNLESKVKAGENIGRTLKHDYVVREFFGAYKLDNKNEFNKNFTLNGTWKNKDEAFKNMGAVIFVQNSQTGEILQSLALPFSQCEVL